MSWSLKSQGERHRQPPFSEEILEGLEMLQVNQEKQGLGTRIYSQLRFLTFRSCSRHVFSGIEAPDLRQADFWATDIDQIQDFGSDKIRSIELVNTHVQDLTPLLDMKKLKWLAVAATPLDERSFREILPALKERGVEEVPDKELTEAHWSLMRDLWDAGIKMQSLTVMDGRTVLKVAGLSWGIENPELWGIPISARQTREVLAANPGCETLEFIAACEEYNLTHEYEE